MRDHVVRMWYLALCLFCLGCDALIEPKPLDTRSCENVKSDLDIVTYNPACAPGMVQRTSDRLNPMIAALKKIDYDVFCLQEAWLPEYRDAIVGALDVPDDQVFAVDTTATDRGSRLGETGEDVCTQDEIAPLERCGRDSCVGVSANETAFCVQSKCARQFAELHAKTKKDQSCLRCIGAMAGRSIDDVVRTCTGPGASRIHDGNNDVMIVSRLPLENKEYLVLPSSNANRVALFVTLTVPKTKVKVELACVHIAASNSYVKPFLSGYDEWEEEKRKQYEMVSEHLRRRAKRKNRAAILAGDLNFGLQIKDGEYLDKESDRSELWKRALEDGFTLPALLEKTPICSGSCPDNKTDPTIGEGALIDHVLLRHPEKDDIEPLVPVCTDQVMEETFIVDEVGPRDTELSYSDHYGIRTKFVVSE